MSVSRLLLENRPPQLMNFHLVRALSVKGGKPHCDFQTKHKEFSVTADPPKHMASKDRFWGAQEPVSTCIYAKATLWQLELYCYWGLLPPALVRPTFPHTLHSVGCPRNKLPPPHSPKPCTPELQPLSLKMDGERTQTSLPQDNTLPSIEEAVLG